MRTRIRQHSWIELGFCIFTVKNYGISEVLISQNKLLSRKMGLLMVIYLLCVYSLETEFISEKVDKVIQLDSITYS